MNHSDRRKWLEEHGWQQESLTRSCRVDHFGESFWFDEIQPPKRDLFLRVSDGMARVHGVGEMTWKELQDWIIGVNEEPMKVKEKKPLQAQRSLFGDE